MREALTNAARHASATRVDVRVHATVSELVVVVADDGVGLEGTDRRSGLANLRARAAARSGTFDVSPGAEGRGTRVTWAVPLA